MTRLKRRIYEKGTLDALRRNAAFAKLVASHQSDPLVVLIDDVLADHGLDHDRLLAPAIAGAIRDQLGAIGLGAESVPNQTTATTPVVRE